MWTLQTGGIMLFSSYATERVGYSELIWNSNALTSLKVSSVARLIALYHLFGVGTGRILTRASVILIEVIYKLAYRFYVSNGFDC